jgi:hypothetical protein
MRWMLVVVAVLVAGCGAQTRTYDVSVENRTDRTVTLWLTKDGPPEEEGWRSPEELAARARREKIKYDMATVDPGKTADTGAMKGKFASGTHAVLRVYEGNPDLAALMSESRESRDRVDYLLTPGKNRLAVVDRDGNLKVIKE